MISIAYLFDYTDGSFGFVYGLAGDEAAREAALRNINVRQVRDVCGAVIWGQP